MYNFVPLNFDALDKEILNVITNWNTNPTCIFFMYENVYHLSNNSNKHFI